MDNRGMMGVGLLIIMIAILILVALTAQMLLTHGQSLQQHALLTSNEVQEGVTAGIDVTTIMGQDASSSDSTPGQIEYLEIVLRLRAGSDSVAFNRTVLLFDYEDDNSLLNYGGMVGEAGIPPNQTHYVVQYISQGPNYRDDYITRGDIVKVKCNLTTPVEEREKIVMTILHQRGITNRLDFATPTVMNKQKIMLYPPSF